MKVLHINCVYGTASTGRIVKGIAECARKQGIKAYAAYSQGTADDPNTFCFGTKTEQKVHAMLSRLTGLQGYYSYFGTRSLLRKMDEIKLDVVHLHNLHSNNINLKMLLRYLAEHDIVTVVTLHDCWFFTGKCCYFTMAGCDRWKAECGNCPNLRTDNKSYFLDRSSKMLYDKMRWFKNIPRLTVVGVSDWITDLAKQSAVFSGTKKILTIHNGIDLTAFRPRQTDIKRCLGLDGKFVVLGLAMGMSRRKGYDDFVQLAEILPKDICIVLAGLTPEQVNKLPKGVIGIEQTANIDKLAEIYSAADVFVNPTYEDNFPTVNIEALACGTPVITYRTGGCPEIVNESCGIVVECGDVDGLKSAILRLKKTNLQKEDCRKRAEAFCQDKKFQEYVNLYKEMVEKTR